MIQPINKKIDFLLYYQCGLAIVAVFTFFTNLDLYLYEDNLFPFPPVKTITIFIVASTPLLFSIFSRIKYFVPLTTWCAGYISISLISFLLFVSSEVAYRELRIRFLSVAFVLTMLLIFSRYYIVQLWTRRAIFIAILIAMVTTIYELFNPLAFNVEVISSSLRPAGFYIDPNKTGCALILGMIFCIGLLKPRYRIYFILLIGSVVLLTFSRGATLSWFVVVIILLSQRVISRRDLLYSVIIILCLWLIGGGLTNLSQIQTNDVNYQNINERIKWFQNPSLSDDSSDARFEVAMLGWQLFAEHPFFGNGLGSTLELSIGISTHNMYLYFMADHGILGLFIIPLLIYAVTRNAYGESKYIGLSFAVLIFLWSLVSHTVLEDRFILMMFSLMAAMAKTSQVEQKFQIGRRL